MSEYSRKKLMKLNKKELEKLLEEKRDRYEEIKQQRDFVLKQTGRHIPGTKRERYKIELEQLQEQIDKIEEVLAEMNEDKNDSKK